MPEWMNRMGRGTAVLAAVILATIVLPATAHVGTPRHEWNKHLRKVADLRYYRIGEKVTDADLLDGVDSSELARGSAETIVGRRTVAGGGSGGGALLTLPGIGEIAPNTCAPTATRSTTQFRNTSGETLTFVVDLSYDGISETHGSEVTDGAFIGIPVSDSSAVRYTFQIGSGSGRLATAIVTVFHGGSLFNGPIQCRWQGWATISPAG
ncbi:MAG: hypothetical protein ACRDIZ_07770 [Actinomycetota bacterium]